MTTSEVDVNEINLSDDEDKIRVYGSTSSENPFKFKRKYGSNVVNVEDSQSSTDIQYDEDAQTQSLISSSGSKSSRKSAVSNLSVSRTDENVSVISSRSWHYRWWQHPKVRDNCRVVIGAFVLTLIGLLLVITGVAIMISPFRGWHSLVFFIGGSLFLIPGLYHVTYIYLAATGRNGYSFHNISVFS
ncbi:transmembrane protein 134-like isoform X1 [Mytilus californianus]|uniref:transmembrane protein 134-like isoform X1 n=1 Tax=Mytilus californianus TaxID=6549 RepID=UPI002245F3D2|nr:transmembrane protein 134-like isoform X1 [Mytilus californianus]